jgi:uncharacterized metal-binding protein YceD (DUF177 family)
VTVSLTIAKLTAAPQTSEASLSTAWCAERLAGVYEAAEPTMAIALTAERHADVVEVHGRLSGAFRCACSRCAEPVELEIDTEFDHHFVGPGQLDAGDPEDPDAVGVDEDPDVSEHDGVRVELDELCIEYAILALPDVPLCQEDCRGLCPRCGVNRNVESCTCDLTEDRSSPWAKLAELRVPKD